MTPVAQTLLSAQKIEGNSLGVLSPLTGLGDVNRHRTPPFPDKSGSGRGYIYSGPMGLESSDPEIFMPLDATTCRAMMNCRALTFPSPRRNTKDLFAHPARNVER